MNCFWRNRVFALGFNAWFMKGKSVHVTSLESPEFCLPRWQPYWYDNLYLIALSPWFRVKHTSFSVMTARMKWEAGEPEATITNLLRVWDADTARIASFLVINDLPRKTCYAPQWRFRNIQTPFAKPDE
jgi:hypothetical protein